MDLGVEVSLPRKTSAEVPITPLAAHDDLRPPTLKIPQRHGKVYNPVSFRLITEAPKTSSISEAEIHPAANAVLPAKSKSLDDAPGNQPVLINTLSKGSSKLLADKLGAADDSLAARSMPSSTDVSVYRNVVVGIVLVQGAAALALLIVFAASQRTSWQGGFEVLAIVLALLGTRVLPPQPALALLAASLWLIDPCFTHGAERHTGTMPRVFAMKSTYIFAVLFHSRIPFACYRRLTLVRRCRTHDKPWLLLTACVRQACSRECGRPVSLAQSWRHPSNESSSPTVERRVCHSCARR
jgi:hypothetical protein